MRINLPRYNQRAGISGAALSHAAAKTATPAQEKTTLRTVPKTMKTPLRQLPNRTNGKTDKLALMNRSYTKTRRTVVIIRSPRRR